MGTETESVVLTEPQAACLKALKNNAGSKTQIAIAAKLNLKTTSNALERLERLRLIERDGVSGWRVSQHGRKTSYAANPNRKQRSGKKPGPGAQRFLIALDRPIYAAELAKRLSITRQRVHQLAVELHALGFVRFGDRGSGFTLIARENDPTELLSRDEEQILSTVSDAFPTSAIKIRSAARLAEERANAALVRLLVLGLIEEVTGPTSERLYGITAAGLTHPQYNVSARRAELPKLPVKSDRVLAVLLSISDFGKVRIKDVAQTLQLPFASINALFQYLKRRSLVRKCGPEFDAPYELTAEGRQVLVEFTRRQAA